MSNINTREICLEILYRINKENAYSNIVLDKKIKKYKLESRDKKFITQIVYGVITYKITLDYIISKHSKIKLNKISEYVLNILRMGIYQTIFMDKIPKHAIVNESVNLAKKYSNKGASGFVNAMLKNIYKDEISNLKFDNEIEQISITTSHPIWLVEKLLTEYSIEDTKKICEYNNIQAPICIRINKIKIEEKELINKLKDLGIKCEKTRIQSSYIVDGLNDISNNDLFKNGYFTIQDSAATLVVNVLEPKENENILDMCCSPGGKTTHIAELMNNTGNIIACDIYSNRLKFVDDNAKRLGITNIKTIQNDGTLLNNNFIDKFDRVLVDAPCSGIGVIRRKVDIKYQRKEEDFNELSNIQISILNNASRYVKKDGIIVYSTCTILEEENEKVIEKFLEENTNFELIDISDNIENNQSNDGYIKTLPHKNNVDGFFIAKLKRFN